MAASSGGYNSSQLQPVAGKRRKKFQGPCPSSFIIIPKQRYFNRLQTQSFVINMTSEKKDGLLRLRVLVTAVDHDGHRPGIVDLHVHVLLETAGTHHQAALPGQVNAVIEEAFRFVRGGGIGEVRSAPAAGIGKEGELADEEKAAFYVKRGEVELIVGIGEDAQVDNLLHHVLGVALGIAAGHADEHDQSGIDAPRLFTIDADAGPADALHEGFHAVVLLASDVPEPEDEGLESDDFEESELEPEPDTEEEEASRWSVT